MVKAFLSMGKLSLDNLAEILQVSSRTVYRTLSELTESLSTHEIQILKEGRQYYLSGDLKRLDFLVSQVAYSPHERLNLITYQLLTNDGPLTNEYLQETYLVSNVTIIQDIAEIEDRLQDFGVELVRQKGYQLVLTIGQRRRLLATLLTNQIDMSRLAQLNFEQFDILDGELVGRAKLVFERYQPELMELDPKLKEFLILLLALADNKMVFQQTGGISKKALDFSQKVFRDLASISKVFYSLQEIGYFATVLDEVIIKRQENPLYTEKFDSEFFYKLTSLIDTVSRYTKIDFMKDKTIFKFLFHHVRLSLGVPIIFPDSGATRALQLISNKNDYLHTVVSLVVKDIFPKYLQTSYEYDLITLHFVSSLRRSPDIYPIDLLLLTDERHLTTELLVTKIRGVAQFINQVDVRPVGSLHLLDLESYDAILATKPIAQQEIKVISTFPSTQELLAIQEYLQTIQEDRPVRARRQKQVPKSYDLHSYLLASDHILQGFSLRTLTGITDFEELVTQVLAQQTNITDTNYLTQKLISRFKVSPMAIPGTNLVLLHTQSSQVKQSSFTMFDLAQPVSALSMNRDEELVNRVLLLLTKLTETDEIRQLMTAISQSVIENKLYTEIYKTGNQEIIYQLLNQIFNEKIKKLEN